MDTITHPSTNQARCSLTSFIKTNVLPLRQTDTKGFSFRKDRTQHYPWSLGSGRFRDVQRIGFLATRCPTSIFLLHGLHVLITCQGSALVFKLLAKALKPGVLKK